MWGRVFIIILLVSCSRKQNIQEEIKIAKLVPENYVMEADDRIRINKDTLYFNDHFFSGFHYSLYDNGDTAFVHSYFNGVEEGLQKKWYTNHQLEEERNYINGKKHGMQRGWWQDGKPKFVFIAANDNYEGEFKEWYASGILGKQFHYRNGKEEGSQRLWWDNGSVRANYVIRDGKKYGLIGLTTCSNPYDSIIKK